MSSEQKAKNQFVIDDTVIEETFIVATLAVCFLIVIVFIKSMKRIYAKEIHDS